MSYAKNFELQWNTFRNTQLDSVLGIPKNANNLWLHTHWPKDLRGKRVLEAGCGPGKYTEVLLTSGAEVVSFDLTTAVHVNHKQNHSKGNLLAFQGDIYKIPLEENSFDYVFCFGVLQHCPDPDLAYRSLFKMLKPGGQICIDYYTTWRYASPWTTPKYFWRPITTRMNQRLLLFLLRSYLPFWLPIDTVIRLISPRLSGWIRIPCWNYLDILKLHVNRDGWWKAYKVWVEWAVMDTFDALSAKYDFPKTIEQVRQMVLSDENSETEVHYGSNGIVANVTKSYTSRG